MGTQKGEDRSGREESVAGQWIPRMRTRNEGEGRGGEGENGESEMWRGAWGGVWGEGLRKDFRTGELIYRETP